MGTSSLPTVNGEEMITVMGRYGIGFEVPLQALQLSPVWRDALHMDSLAKASETLDTGEPVAKRRKITKVFKLDENDGDLYILFRILQGDIGMPEKDRNQATWTLYKAHSLLPRSLNKLGDKYDIPKIEPRFWAQLWELAPSNKEQALYIFVVAWKREDFPLTQHAMRHFRDLPHPENFSRKMAASLGLSAFWYLVNITRGRTLGRTG